MVQSDMVAFCRLQDKVQGVVMWNILITIVGIIAIILIWIMLYDSNRFVVVQHAFCDPRIRRKVRAVVLADLHDKQFGKDNSRLLEAIKEQKPDIILIAGDVITAKPGRKTDKAVAFLKELSGQYPVYYANGNHEHRLKLYPDVYGDKAEEYEKSLQSIGISRLVNSHAALADAGITVYGSEIDKLFYRRFHVAHMEEDYLEKLIGKKDENSFGVLIAHNPDYFPQYAAWGADLVLSGHVHGGMVRIPGWKGIVSPAVRLFPKYDGGLFYEGKSTMLLSRGLGMHTIPIRLFNPGELIVVDFKSKEEEK